jgi:UDP-2,3-diacylglucosamine pyrophosphatase LpxH
LLISDLHLGSYRCNIHLLLEFLSTARTKVLYLVGDIIDFWSLRAGASWSPSHAALVRRLCEMLDRGTRVIVIPGNHDEHLLRLTELTIPGVEVRREYVHETCRGKRYLVVHGHEQDPFFGHTNMLVRVACQVGERIGKLCSHWNDADKPFTMESDRLWTSIGRISGFHRALVREVQKRGLDGVICGHTHIPADVELAGIRYLNCGDWIRNCSAIVETGDGDMRLLRADRPVAKNSCASAAGARQLDGEAILWLKAALVKGAR